MPSGVVIVRVILRVLLALLKIKADALIARTNATMQAAANGSILRMFFLMFILLALVGQVVELRLGVEGGLEVAGGGEVEGEGNEKGNHNALLFYWV